MKQDGLTRQARDEHDIGDTMRRFLQTVRCVLRATIDGRVFELGTDETWEENPGPIKYASIYVGVSHDARLETPGWDLPGTNAHRFTYISSVLQTTRNDGFLSRQATDSWMR